VDELPTDLALAALDAIALQATLAVNALPSAAGQDAAALFDVDVDQLAGMATLVAVGRLGRLEPRQLAQPDAQQHRRTPSTAPSPNPTRSPRRSSAAAATPR